MDELGQKHITHFELSGYRSIKNVKSTFQKGLNIIIGNNGSGKSNLLEFINKILKRDYNGLDEFNAKINIIDEDDVQKEWIASGKSTTETLENILGGDNLDIIEPPESENAYNEFIRFNFPDNISILAKEYNPKFNSKESRFISEESSLDIPMPLYWGISLFFPLLDLKNIPIEELTDKFLYEKINSFFNSLFADVKKDLITYSPIQDIRFSNSIRVVKIDSTTVEIRNIVFEYKINEEWFGWDALSDGTKRLVYIAFIIGGVSLNVKVNEDNKVINLFPICFLEEPEIGIHPHQLHSLMTLLKEKSRDRQIVISTHSPQVLDILSKNELDRITIAEIDYEHGTNLRKLTPKEIEKTLKYFETDGLLSDYWRFSDFQRQKNSK